MLASPAIGGKRIPLCVTEALLLIRERHGTEMRVADVAQRPVYSPQLLTGTSRVLTLQRVANPDTDLKSARTRRIPLCGQVANPPSNAHHVIECRDDRV